MPDMHDGGLTPLVLLSIAFGLVVTLYVILL